MSELITQQIPEGTIDATIESVHSQAIHGVAPLPGDAFRTTFRCRHIKRVSGDD